mmetsp:Transcript_18511/g.51478  ORF Transcript_18511/g.51478 Transcript_18511/m.51478 type:complete len:241 (-) Transcript_18511:234-956(-)
MLRARVCATIALAATGRSSDRMVHRRTCATDSSRCVPVAPCAARMVAIVPGRTPARAVLRVDSSLAGWQSTDPETMQCEYRVRRREAPLRWRCRWTDGLLVAVSSLGRCDSVVAAVEGASAVAFVSKPLWTSLLSGSIGMLWRNVLTGSLFRMSPAGRCCAGRMVRSCWLIVACFGPDEYCLAMSDGRQKVSDYGLLFDAISLMETGDGERSTLRMSSMVVTSVGDNDDRLCFAMLLLCG